MSVYKRFEPTDIIHYNVTTSPKITLSSGSSGWRGNVGTSSSLSLYGGIRSREVGMASNGIHIQPFIELPSFDIDGIRILSGTYPFSASVKNVKLRLDQTGRYTDADWGEEHWASIQNLYSYYSRFNTDYVTGSYDYYCLFFNRDSANRVRYTCPATSASLVTKFRMSSSYTFEAWVKPQTITLGNNLYTTGSNYLTIVGDSDNRFWFFISGSKLAFSASDGSGVIRTSSLAITKDRWQHVSYRVGGNSGSFTIDLVDAGTYNVTGSLDSDATPIVYVGNSGGTQDKSFHGMIHEFRMWNVKRTADELSASFNCVLNNSSSDNLVTYSRFNDGPLGTKHGTTAGSGAVDFSNNMVHGVLENFNRHAPVWLPNDNVDFTARKVFAEGAPRVFRIIEVPSIFYGRQIATGSVKITCNAFLSSSLMRTLVDDGRGGLYISGSMTSASLDTRESYEGVKWNKVGNVFYSEGIIVIKDPSIVDFGEMNSVSALNMATNALQIEFKGLQKIPSNVFMCRVNGAEFNGSSNPTYSRLNENSGKYEIVRETPVTYITAVGLYNEEHKLVAVAKLAQPIRNREKDKINIKLKMDF